MPLHVIDTAAEEPYIVDTIGKIKKYFRPLASVKLKWFIHRILPTDTILVEWKQRHLQDLEIDISQWFSSKERLSQILWHEMSYIRDELDPIFNYRHDYVRQTYGPNSQRQKYFPLIKTVWGIYNCGQLARQNLPTTSQEILKNQFAQCFGISSDLDEWFHKILNEHSEYKFEDIEKLAQKLKKINKI